MNLAELSNASMQGNAVPIGIDGRSTLIEEVASLTRTIPTDQEVARTRKRMKESLVLCNNHNIALANEIQHKKEEAQRMNRLENKIYRDLKEEETNVSQENRIFSNDIERELVSRQLAMAMASGRSLGYHYMFSKSLSVLESRIWDGIQEAFYDFKIDLMQVGEEDRYYNLFNHLIRLVTEAISYDDDKNTTKIKIPKAGIDKIKKYADEGFLKLSKKDYDNIEGLIISLIRRGLRGSKVHLRRFGEDHNGDTTYIVL